MRNADTALALALEGRAPARDHETASLLAVADALRALPMPEIDPAFANALEQRLMAEGLEASARPGLRLVTESAPTIEAPVSDVVVALPRRRVQVRRSAVAAAAILSLGAMPVVAAAAALPGSPFYGVKQALHAAQISFLGDAAADAERRLGFAAGHIDEAEQLVALRAGASRVGLALDLATDELAAAGATVRTVADTDDLASFATKAAATDRLIRDAASVLAPEASEAFGRTLAASRKLQVTVRTALGLPAVIVTTTDRIDDAVPTDVRKTNEVPSTKATTDPTESSDPTAPKSDETTPTDSNPATQPAGKAVTGAKSYGCSLPGQVELDQLLGSNQPTCAHVSIP